MLPEQIEITDSEVEIAEKSLLPPSCQFDDERDTFIKNLESIDLQAVPSSGKTTALLAKLLILERYLPFDNGSGILVISHTNSAVDEIKNKIGDLCPKLFSYPNFVGTIQSFVDNYLAIPFYVNCFHNKPVRIDDQIYDEKIERYKLPYGANSWVQRRINPLEFIKKLRMDKDLNLIGELNKSAGEFILKNSAAPTYQALKRMKKDILKQGILHYDDAYFLAEVAIKKIPRFKKILQGRFTFVFVDEMQDMDLHQYNLLEKLFFDEGNSETVYQRIGDKNQAIFDGEVKLEDIWVYRANRLELNGSNRLSGNNAGAVKYFGLEFIEIEGRNRNSDGSEINIKPHIIVFDDRTKSKVIEKFADIIKEFQNGTKIPLNPKYPFKVICWRKEVEGNNKIALTDYFDFKVDKHKPKVDYECLSDFIRNCKLSSNEFREVRKNIINALLKILRLEEVQSTDGRNFTESKLILFIKDNSKHTELYELFMKKIFLWSKGIIQGKHEDVITKIKTYIPEFLLLFGKTINKSRDFISLISTNSQQPTTASNNKSENVFIKNGVEVEITTIHASKGQTHTATLYLESFFYQGLGHYESERLKQQFKNTSLATNAIKVVKQSARMVYVGFSRPTHLLCFAVHKNRFDANLSDIDRNKWEVIELL
ncbi:MAG: UvrD-helicase domain-containing protein [Candidatus Lokiarchaeota archaeon]|nr:UvrD-helicase domain-containing protein [Candidatus Lokiarchaeota archaeon]